MIPLPAIIAAVRALPWQWIAAGGVALALGAWGFTLKIERDLARAGRAEARAELRVCQAQNEVLVGTVNRQNTALEDFRKVGEALIAETSKTLAAVRQANQATVGKIAAIEAKIQAPAPVKADGTAADCRDAWAEIERRARE